VFGTLLSTPLEDREQNESSEGGQNAFLRADSPPGRRLVRLERNCAPVARTGVRIVFDEALAGRKDFRAGRRQPNLSLAAKPYNLRWLRALSF
jgi:hypothetical protein